MKLKSRSRAKRTNTESVPRLPTFPDEDGVYRTETSMVFFEFKAGQSSKAGLVALTGIETVFRP